MAKKRYRGHYCKICGEVKANEKFSGKGHKNHTCKACSKLSQSDKNQLMTLGKIENIELSGFILSKANIDKLKSYIKNSEYPKVRKYAKQVLDNYNERMEERKDEQGSEEVECLFEDELYIDGDDEYLISENDEELPF